MKRTLQLLLLLPLLAALAAGDAGVLIPRDKAQPDPNILSLDEMEVTIRIDNGNARVFVRQVFGNHTGRIEEGNYVFALPNQATVSDFATWDGPTRLPAVILERKRAEEIYANLKNQMIDPGLLQQGERGSEEARRSAVFSAKIVPIPPYGTKRLEIEYHQRIPVENLKSYFALPLHPDAYHAQVAEHLWINFELTSAHPIRDFKLGSKLYPLQITEQNAHTVKGRFEGRKVTLAEDFSVGYDLQATGDSLEVITYRNPVYESTSPDQVRPERSTNEPGFFQADALLAGGSTTQAAGASRNVVILFDNSLSMQWDKLERNYEAMEKLLRSLRPADRFNLILFNTQINSLQSTLIPAELANIQKALDFVRASRLRGGTDLQKALETGLAQCNAANCYLVLLSDGGASRGTISNGKLTRWYTAKWKQLPEAQRPRTYVFAVGDDANLPLLRMLARNDGVLESVLSTESAEFKLNAFLSKIGRSPVAQLRMETSPQGSVDLVYPLQESAFSGTIATWVGQYKKPQRNVGFDVRGVRDAQAFEARKNVDLPEKSLDHPQLPRLWARARVDWLLEKIEKEGEDRATIDEIIRLSRKYKFVTPYTSFLAVPRALLRPRVIRPGDPVLRVRTDPAIKSVIALFPFGLTKPLRHLPDEDIWQTRFLAPTDMQDGTYSVRLILHDGAGNTYRESKTFVIASKPPVVRVNLEYRRYRRGQSVPLKVSASEMTRTITARLENSAPVSLRWNQQAGANTGQLEIPADMPVGTYRLTVTAEDIAHNIGTQEVQLEVVP